MSDYDNTNTFSLFKNDKGDNLKRPDYKGKVNIDGREFWLSGWIRTSKDGNTKFISGATQPVEVQEQAKAAPAQQTKIADLDSDLPF